MNRRDFVALMGLAAGSQALPSTAQAEREMPAPADAVDYTAFVRPAVGTGGHGHTFPGATVPFGAVQLSPDTYTIGWDWCSGYHDSDTSIMGFSHTHLSGTGASDLLDVLVAPRVGEVKLQPGSRENPEEGYRSRFSHANEVMEPGYYSVHLDTPKIFAEMTATERTGLHRYTFPASDQAHFVVDLYHTTGDQAKSVQHGEVELRGKDTILGGRITNSWSPHRQIYFAMKFSKPWTECDLYAEDEKKPGTSVQGKIVKAVPHFKTQQGEKVLVKVGISMASAANAMLNLEKEQSAWAFDAIRAEAKRRWNHELGKIQISGSTKDHRTIFYTAMYHMMCAPTIADDVNGEYLGMDHQTHTLAAGEHNYSTFSLWDTFRAYHPSLTLWQKERVPGMVNCLVSMAEQSPAGMPIWPLQAGETNCMTGYHSATVIAEAYVKKFPGVDWKRAYAVMRKRNMEEDFRGLALYRQYGYIPADKDDESVSKVLEYDYNDWACSKVAEGLGQTEDAKTQRERSLNYRHLFDPQTKFLRAKLANGEWTPGFDPRSTGHWKKWRDYTESNPWQATFGVQHDVLGHIKLFGGREAFTEKLDAMFKAEPGLSNENLPDITGSIGQYVHGNEPSHHILYLYTYAGQPWKTQKWVREVLETQYHNDPDGVAGNEDCGQMSAWYLMSALGIYPVDPISATYVLTAPHFDRAALNVGGGKQLVIEAKRTSADDRYVQSVTLNGRPLDRLWVKHDEIAHGATLRFVVGSEPNMKLATDVSVAPPSMTS